MRKIIDVAGLDAIHYYQIQTMAAIAGHSVILS
jgi:hypothetical protein